MLLTIYNNSDKNLQVIEVGGSLVKGETDGISLGDDLTQR